MPSSTNKSHFKYKDKDGPKVKKWKKDTLFRHKQ